MMCDDKQELRIIIAGGRTFNDYDLLSIEASNLIKALIDSGHFTETDIRIISGHAMGADKLGERFATESGFNLTIFPANWVRLGKSAGYIRNQTMADYAKEGDHVGVLIAFWNGKSRGTKHMIDIAEGSGLQVRVVRYAD